MKTKSETEECSKEYVEKMFTETWQCPRILRSGNRGEYTSNSSQKWLSTKGILHQTCATHSPQQNGVSERDIIELQWKVPELSYMPRIYPSTWSSCDQLYNLHP
jgi:hypothetical protein